jgi:acyl-CoA thioesterase FadM
VVPINPPLQSGVITVLREGELLCEGTVRVASICADSFRPKAIPDFMQAQLAELLPARAGA